MAVDAGLNPSERLDLVAYLDGELDEENARAVATQLAADANARLEAEALERTWELLDNLPQPRASEALGSKTLQAVTELALETIRAESIRQVQGRRRRLAIAVLAVCASFFLGLSLPGFLAVDRTGQLARDLGIAEHLDEYRDAGDLDFLYLLQKSREFGDGD